MLLLIYTELKNTILMHKLTYLHRLYLNLCQVTKSPRLYVLFRTAVPGVFAYLLGWCGACHLTI